MAREPIVSGQFYESDSFALLKQIKECFLSRFGPGRLQKPSINNNNNKRILGLISPHAGFPYSGMCASHGFLALAESKPPDTIILLGLSHSGFPSRVSIEDWRTPLGTLKNNTVLAKKIVEKCDLQANEHAHREEHSIEVQLPFLQFIQKDLPAQSRIVPIIVSFDKDPKELGIQLAKIIKSEKGIITILASSDFSHIGFGYGYSPFKENIKENMYKLDKGAIDRILKLKPSLFLEYTEQTGATICGKFPIAVLLETLKNLGINQGKLLKYYTSGDVSGDYRSAVGYASIVFEG